MRLKRSVHLGRPFGIPLLVHGSWFPAAALLITHFMLSVFAAEALVPALLYSVLSTLVFFACLVAHELGHALVARSLGIGVIDITLFIFGGVARIAKEPSRPAQEIVIAAAGPVVSAVLGVAFLVGGPSGETGLALVAWTIGMANVALALFNLLPGFPLDGGRILRAVLWGRTGDPNRAALAAGRIGQLLGLLLAAGGLVLFLSTGTDAPGGGAAEGLWLAVVGSFLYVLATGARRAARVAATLARHDAGGWATPFAGTLRSDALVDGLSVDGGAYAVSDDGRLAGVLVPGTSTFAVPAARAADVMVPWTPRMSFRASQPLSRALERLAADPRGVLVVVDEQGGVVGVLDQRTVRERLSRPGGRA